MHNLPGWYTTDSINSSMTWYSYHPACEVYLLGHAALQDEQQNLLLALHARCADCFMLVQLTAKNDLAVDQRVNDAL